MPTKMMLMARRQSGPYVSPRQLAVSHWVSALPFEDAVRTQHSPLGASSWGRPSASISVFTMGCPELL